MQVAAVAAVTGHVVAVGEVDVRVRAKPCSSSSRLGEVRVSFQPMCGTRASAGKRSTVPEDAEAAHFRRFFARSNSACRPRQIPRNGTPALMRSSKRCAHAELVERAHHLAEMADAGEDDLRCACRPVGVAHQLVLAPISSSVFCTERRLPAP